MEEKLELEKEILLESKKKDMSKAKRSTPSNFEKKLEELRKLGISEDEVVNLLGGNNAKDIT